MRITVQHFNDCPHWLTTTERLERVLEATGIDAEVRLQLVNTTEAAAAHDFRGSPTVLINGTDPVADPNAPVGLSCRIYSTPEGPSGSPTINQLTQAITNPKD